jgi:hypothetical protein
MTDLIKELRELHAKTTQGEWLTILPTSDIIMESHGLYGKPSEMTDEDNSFICKVHNDLPRLLDELEAWKKEADDLAHKELDASYENANLRIELDRYKKALKVCKEQRNDAIRCQGDDFYWDFDSHDKELDQILKGGDSE